MTWKQTIGRTTTNMWVFKGKVVKKKKHMKKDPKHHRKDPFINIVKIDKYRRVGIPKNTSIHDCRQRKCYIYIHACVCMKVKFHVSKWIMAWYLRVRIPKIQVSMTIDKGNVIYLYVCVCVCVKVKFHVSKWIIVCCYYRILEGCVCPLT